ncbi:AGAP000940-PA-like protein [Anopheles sinensis]|uniref:AGAP000940-PA-like protein n=1 Tax=Anopheles sinensis TaxID=74873 RepID=A0A084VIR4_ANOSI|nr:AGAP000940-PA-like protein [Anopheles sinensis]
MKGFVSKRCFRCAFSRFSSSKALDPASGYWAEAIPAMEQPLCAVVDPVRDFRWHALRCGGPETAAFLCELPVPAWAMDCTVTSIPSLTVQYMSDSGTVQLSRDCGESGTKHISCQGKQDRDSIVEQLQCSDEEDLLASVLATENNNQLPVAQQTDGDSTRRPHLQQPILEHDILTVVSSNDEDSTNNIEVNPNQIEDTVKNVINKFNLQDLMRSEQAALHSDEAGVGGAVAIGDAPGGEGARKPSVYGKKYSPLYEKKKHYAKKPVEEGPGDSAADEEDEDDEQMMGDQPIVDELETQPIDIIQQAVKPTADGDYADPTVLVVGGAGVEGSPSAAVTVSSTVNPEASGSTPDSRLRRATDSDGAEELASTGTTEALTTQSDVTEGLKSSPTTTTEAPTTTVPTTSVPPVLHTTRTTASSHILPTTPKKDVITGDHFIPPMLLVKARFISARPHTEPPATTMLPTTPSTTTLPSVDTTVSDASSTAGLSSTSAPLAHTTLVSGEVSTVSHAVEIATEAATAVERNESESTSTTHPSVVTEAVATEAKTNDPLAPQALALSSGALLHKDDVMESISTPSTTLDTPTEHTTEVVSTSNPAGTIVVDVGCVQSTTVTGSPSADGVVSDSNTTSAPETSASVTVVTTSAALPQRAAEINTSTVESVSSENQHSNKKAPDGSSMESVTGAPSVQHEVTVGPTVAPQGFGANGPDPAPLNVHEHENDDEQEHSYEQEQHSDLHNSFSNIENYQPYKPNRHRSLTKPEVHNNHGGAYIKKILG